MKRIAIMISLFAAFGLSVLIPQGQLFAAQSEKLYVCGPCSSFFIEEARTVVENMGVADMVTVRRSSCLGACAEPPVIEFRGRIYVEMTGEKLRSMLESELGIY